MSTETKTVNQPSLDDNAVREAYRWWAPIYDYSFGMIAGPGRRLAVDKLNEENGRILEVGVGTGLSLPRYRTDLDVTGIDLSPEMLSKAAQRVNRLGLRRKTLLVMDASRLSFADESFDAAAVMYVMTVVPEPAAVMAELRRVLKPGGTAIIVNHFSREKGARAGVEKWLAKYSRSLGWHPIFPIQNVTEAPGFELVDATDAAPLGVFTLLRLKKVG
ncbi:SAM-dependent methlyltransferase [Rhodomicrobium udaipurense JA643]|uniref:Class I SAM-dependent methyltransferase n=1 Tax=Rhodomicrobium udaipurense TaxID=1202716 RepID=A0A8I1KJR8_9HYPH|nr:class I SAM-dependent methyltransferase [Rhodomicrobium udaipurense]KAI95853.1 SAM-dependent methlyltransferase [Rhodomicrobium udaipurense JA643]MBJ7543189.1 class I SAM-dependent methyltransferase [Rhodomicrobium udaipurense]